MSALKLNLSPVAPSATPGTAGGIAGALNARDDNAAAQRERAFGDLLSHGGDSGAAHNPNVAPKPARSTAHTAHRDSTDTTHDALAWLANSRATHAELQAHPAAAAATAAAHGANEVVARGEKNPDDVGAIGSSRRAGTAAASVARTATARPDATPVDAATPTETACAAPAADSASRNANVGDGRKRSAAAATLGVATTAVDGDAPAPRVANDAATPTGPSDAVASSPANGTALGATTAPGAAPTNAAVTSPAALRATSATMTPDAANVAAVTPNVAAPTAQPIAANGTPSSAGPSTLATFTPFSGASIDTSAPSAAPANDSTSAAFIATTAAANASAAAAQKAAMATDLATSGDPAIAPTGAAAATQNPAFAPQAALVEAAPTANGNTFALARAAAMVDTFAASALGAAGKTTARSDETNSTDFDSQAAASVLAGTLGSGSTAPPPVGTLDAKTAVPAVHDPQFADALGARLSWLAERHIGSAQVSLSPEALGPLDVRVHLAGERVRAEFASAHAEVRQAIAAHVPRLRELLAQRGFTLTDAQVGGGQAQAQPHAAPAPLAARSAPKENEPVAATAATQPLRVAHDGLLDAFA